jgi:hypothetical protein
VGELFEQRDLVGIERLRFGGQDAEDSTTSLPERSGSDAAE